MIIAFIIAAFVIAADQISKYIVKTNMNIGQSFNLIPNILNIRYIENEGASFGILKDHRWIFMSLSSVALAGMCVIIIYLSRRSVRKNNFYVNVALSFMFGGGIGNMIDRLFNESVYNSSIEKGKKVVVDFLEFDFIDFAVFNFADAFICIGSVLLCVCIFAGKYRLHNVTHDAIMPEPPQQENETENIYD